MRLVLGWLDCALRASASKPHNPARDGGLRTSEDVALGLRVYVLGFEVQGFQVLGEGLWGLTAVCLSHVESKCWWPYRF